MLLLSVDGELAVGIGHRAHTIGAVADDSTDDRLAALVHDDAHKVLAVTDIFVVGDVGSAHDDDVVVLSVGVEAVPADKPVDDGHGGLVVSLERDAEVDIIIVVLYLQPRKLFHLLQSCGGFLVAERYRDTVSHLCQGYGAPAEQHEAQQCAPPSSLPSPGFCHCMNHR